MLVWAWASIHVVRSSWLVEAQSKSIQRRVLEPLFASCYHPRPDRFLSNFRHGARQAPLLYLEPFLALCRISSVTTSLRDRPDQKIVQSTSERTKGEGSTSVTTLQTDL